MLLSLRSGLVRSPNRSAVLRGCILFLPVRDVNGTLGRAYLHRIPLAKLKCFSPKRREEMVQVLARGLAARRRGEEPGGARRVECRHFDLVRERHQAFRALGNPYFGESRAS